MYQFDITAGSKADLYRDLLGALDALTADEPDAIANMANAAALVWQYLPDLNWAGFYRMVEGELVLGPFQGKAACIRIPLGKGVCGTAAATRETQLVEDRPCLSRPYRLRRGKPVRTGRADRPRWAADRRARPRQSRARPLRCGGCRRVRGAVRAAGRADRLNRIGTGHLTGQGTRALATPFGA